MTALSELTCLGLHRPSPDAEPGEVAAFLSEISTIHDHLASEASGHEAARERALAARFRSVASGATTKEMTR